METEKKLSDYFGKTLLLTQLKFLGRDYELKCGDETIACISHPKWYSSNFEITWNENKWFIYHPSIWRNAVEIKEVNKELPLASYNKTRFKMEGLVNLPMGQQLKISFKMYRGSYEVQNISGECLVLIKDKFSWKDKTEFYIQKRSELLDKYPWVILLAWHTSAQRKRHSGVTAA
jgi:hypothetical protein